MSTTLIGNNFKGWNDDGTPAAGAYLYTYASGTTTPLATYTDATLGTPNANPVVLNSRGEANVWLGPSTYSLKLTTNTGTQIGSTIDGVTSIDGLISASAATIEALYSAATGSTLIGYKASFTGAIQRTVQSKLSDFTSATDASVDTTGVTDCHAAIQAAINSGADVRLPPGTYNIGTGGLTLTGSQCLEGAGGVNGITNLVYSGTGDAVAISGNYNQLVGVNIISTSALHSGISVISGTKNYVADIGMTLSNTNSAGLLLASGSGTYWNTFEEFSVLAGTPIVLTATGSGSTNQNIFQNMLVRSNVPANGIVVFLNGTAPHGVGNNMFWNVDASYYGTGNGICFDLQGTCGTNQFINCYVEQVAGANCTGYYLSNSAVTNTQIIGGTNICALPIVDSSGAKDNFFSYNGSPLTFTGIVSGFGIATSQSANVGDADKTLVVGTSEQTQFWATTLTANRTVTLSNTFAQLGARFRIVRTGLGAFTLNVGPGLKTLPSATAAWCDVEYGQAGWAVTAYGTL